MSRTIQIMMSYQKYLEVKRTIDDRSLNQHVFRSLRDKATGPGRQRVLEIGSGIGTMVVRGIEWGLLENVEYTAVDMDPENIDRAHSYLDHWAKENGFSAECPESTSILLTRGRKEILVHLRVANALDLIKKDRTERCDLLLAHLFLDLVDVSQNLRPLIDLLVPGGTFYFSLIFDGSTFFGPPIDPELDSRLISTFHDTMDRKLPTGAGYRCSETGRQVLDLLVGMDDVQIIDVGSSDWIICPRSGGYSPEEVAFLEFIIGTISEAITGKGAVDGDRVREWVEKRYQQIREGKLIYIAHQIDVVGSVQGR